MKMYILNVYEFNLGADLCNKLFYIIITILSYNYINEKKIVGIII